MALKMGLPKATEDTMNNQKIPAADQSEIRDMIYDKSIQVNSGLLGNLMKGAFGDDATA